MLDMQQGFLPFKAADSCFKLVYKNGCLFCVILLSFCTVKFIFDDKNRVNLYIIHWRGIFFADILINSRVILYSF